MSLSPITQGLLTAGKDTETRETRERLGIKKYCDELDELEKKSETAIKILKAIAKVKLAVIDVLMLLTAVGAVTLMATSGGPSSNLPHFIGGCFFGILCISLIIGFGYVYVQAQKDRDKQKQTVANWYNTELDLDTVYTAIKDEENKFRIVRALEQISPRRLEAIYHYAYYEGSEKRNVLLHSIEEAFKEMDEEKKTIFLKTVSENQKLKNGETIGRYISEYVLTSKFIRLFTLSGVVVNKKQQGLYDRLTQFPYAVVDNLFYMQQDPSSITLIQKLHFAITLFNKMNQEEKQEFTSYASKKLEMDPKEGGKILAKELCKNNLYISANTAPQMRGANSQTTY